MEFEKKVSSLLSSSTKNAKNLFVTEAMKATNIVLSGNGSVKYSTSGNDFVDNFASISRFKEPRSYQEVDKDMRLLWSINPELCLKLAVYIRLITRKSKIVDFKNNVEVLDTQRGTGLKHEAIMRMLWIAINYPNVFKNNVFYYIAAGSWKDIFKMMSLDLQYHGWNKRRLDWNFLFNVIAAGYINSETTHLVRKYLPTIRTNKNCKTIESQANTLIGRWLAVKFSPGTDKSSAFKNYRKMKSEGIAHKWQQLISKQLYDQINFDEIAGRALSLLVGSKFLQNHNLIDKYKEWIGDKKEVKYTGFVFELFKPLGEYNYQLHHVEKHIEDTINAQFNHLVQEGKNNVNTNSGLIVVRDTSGSMMSNALGCNMSSFAIAKAMALYFSEFLSGYFSNSFIEFNSRAAMHQWKGETPCDKWVNDQCDCVGNTNFQTVIDLFIRLKNQGIPENEFPSGILAISDGELDYCGNSSNFNTAIKRLRAAGFSKEYVDNFKIILWDIPNSHYHKKDTTFEDFADAPGFYYLSGYDGSIISFLLEGKVPDNAEQLFYKAMNQELLNKLKV